MRGLSKTKVAESLENRHGLSQTVHAEVSSRSRDSVYSTGSVYIRKVHFRASEMIKKIESKVVNRLRQVTSAIKQEGTNQVNIISSTAERQAAIELAKAPALKPRIVDAAYQKISENPELARALYTILDLEKMKNTEMQPR